MIPIKDKNFQKIICFYLFQCPARSIRTEDKKANEPRTVEQPHPSKRIFFNGKISQMGKTLEERGIVGGKVNTLRAAMLRAAGRDFKFITVTGKNAIKPEAKEYVSLSRADFKTEGIFIFIRNAFAHGEFSVSDGWYELENHSGVKLKGQALLRESTLLKWIEIVNMPIEEMKMVGR